ncbi:hypothetical protein [Allofournierella massiliensis]|uniref:DUF4358 domain-containing protein n=1 Tax=Allofournierella massiliensis TaxID=1650663 RepID=A0ABT7UM39_9FIRM|nr:hypothetical protein [Fournierella massiliensis]MDM8199953.1 hypothetical protein [Fournierella massiliensis]
MKKLAITLTALTLALALAACGSTAGSSSSTASSGAASTSSSASSSASSESSSTAAVATSDLTSLMDALFSGIAEDQMPMLMPQEDGSKYAPLTEENSEYNTGVALSAYKEGICAEAAMSAQAHSICLLKANSAEEAAKLAEDVAANANPNKWICVSAERTIVAYSGDTVLLAMSFNDLAQTVLNNFTAQFGAENVTVVKDETGADMAMPEGGDVTSDPVAAMPEDASGAL